MKSVYLYILFSFFTGWAAAQTLSGKVTDSETKEPLPGAAVFISDLKIGTVTNVDGHYEIKNLPKSKFIVQVKMIGYAALSVAVDLSVTKEKNFQMKRTAVEGPEVVVTGSAFTTEQTKSSVPVVPINKISIVTVGAENIVQALTVTPGVSSVNTGEAISKPVIRGLGYNRIVTVNEGVRQEGQQWGDEHGVEIDEFSADHIEVLKGPSSLLYGSDALGGVINILEPIPPPVGVIRGTLDTRYATNNSLSANSVMLEGNHSGFVWRGRGSYKNAAPYKTPVETVYNSAFNEFNGEGLLGLNRSWGYAHLHISRFASNIGLTEGERDSTTGKLLDDKGNIATPDELASRKLFLPHQHITHTKISSVNNFIFGKSQLRLNAGWQQNDRQEFATSPDEPGLWFHLNTFTYDGKYYFPSRDSLELVAGLGGMAQTNENKGEEFLIPDYSLYDFGAFFSAKKTFTDFSVNAGLRYDIRHIDGDEKIVDAEQLFAPFTEDFSAVSGSVGATYQINRVWNIKANIGRGFRAPNISELSANGLHEGTFRFEVGNTKLKPETSLQFDLGIAADGEMLTASLDGFYNVIDHFIYYRHFEADMILKDSTEYPVYRYVQGNSVLKGFEFTLDIHPVKNLHFENSISYVDAFNNDLNRHLPFIPPVKIENELKYTFQTSKTAFFSEPYVKVSLENALKQDKIDVFETVTAGYTLINAGVGSHLRLGKQSALIYVQANNIGDVKYFNHLSRLKEVNIYEMGRNITFGISVPFGLK